MKILILGAGMMGRAAALFLAGKPDVSEIILADMSLENAQKVAKWAGSEKIKPVRFDAIDKNRIRELMEGCTVAIGATSYDHNLLYTETAIDCLCSFIDLGGNHDVVDAQFALNDKAKAAGIAVIPDCGLAPGLVNILSARAADKMENVDSIQIRVGGVPVEPLPPLNYCLLFNARGLINEYIEKARIIRDGNVEIVDSMGGLETIHFPEPFGKMEAFYTSGGISTLTQTLPGKVQNLDYKTIRYPGHQMYIKFLIDMGMTSSEPIKFNGFEISPRRVLEKTLEKNLQSSAADAILLRVTARGEEHGFVSEYTQEIIDFYDMEHELTSMMRMTAFPAATIAYLIARGDLSDRGVLYQERSVPFKEFFRELEKMDIIFAERHQQIKKA